MTGALQAAGVCQVEISLGIGPEIRFYQLEASSLNDWRGWEVGCLLLLHDVSGQKHVQAQLLDQQRALATLQERDRVARELHDSLGQVLGYVKMQAQAARGLLARNQPAEADTYLTQLVAVVQDAHADVREYILGAQTGTSTEAGFLPALDQYLRRFSENYGIATELSAPPELSDGAFEPMVAAQLLRIIQEALTNVRKHARAHCVQVNLSCNDGHAEAIVQDDGAGFDPEVLGTAEGQRFGLRFMQERAAGVGGRVEIHSVSGEGTRVVICVPLRKESL
jgi:signal transduction histidine kinase